MNKKAQLSLTIRVMSRDSLRTVIFLYAIRS